MSNALSPETSLALSFAPSEIVCVEDNLNRLYAEVVQMIESRQTCWVRPLLLQLQIEAETQSMQRAVSIYDLRQGSDLLMPIELFRPALDTEVIPLLSQLNQSNPINSDTSVSHCQLTQFINLVCSTRPDLFQQR